VTGINGQKGEKIKTITWNNDRDEKDQNTKIKTKEEWKNKSEIQIMPDGQKKIKEQGTKETFGSNFIIKVYIYIKKDHFSDINNICLATLWIFKNK
jgi:hypothetical protein